MALIEVFPANAERAKVYSSKNFNEAKTLMPDGSVVAGMPVEVTVAFPSDTLSVSTKNPTTSSAPVASSVGVASAQVLAANANRKGCLLVNTSLNYVSLGFGNAAVLYSGITLNPNGGCFWMDEYSFSTVAIFAIASGAASNLGVQEII